LSLIACSFWIGCALQREYTMGQPLKSLFQNDLAKCPVEKSPIKFGEPERTVGVLIRRYKRVGKHTPRNNAGVRKLEGPKSVEYPIRSELEALKESTRNACTHLVLVTHT
jgi:hypothetical protein